MTSFQDIIVKIASQKTLSEDQATFAFENIMAGKVSNAMTGAFLMGLHMRGETVTEITAAARAMRANAQTVQAPKGAVDTCGTGGDGAHSLNISTAAALVAASCGLVVAKHGNRGVSSSCGSADVLTALGVKCDIPPAVVEQCFQQAGIGFMFAAAHHKAMHHVAPVRKELGLRTIFNLLGPLANPANTQYQLVGVFSKAWVEPLAQVLKNLGASCVWVVHGEIDGENQGLDEITTTGTTHVAKLLHGKITTFTLHPEDFAMAKVSIKHLRGGDAQKNAEALRNLLDGAKGPYYDIVVLNSAATLVIGGKAGDISQGIAMAKKALDSKAAKQTLARLVQCSNSAAL